MSVVGQFKEIVIDSFAYTAPSGETLSYVEYLTLPLNQRSADEIPVVDMLVTQRILRWLGYEPGMDYTYNEAHKYNRPDFVVHLARTVLFVWEDKNTTEEFGPGVILQLQRYTAGTQGYAVWSNGRRLVLLHFEPRGEYRVLLSVDFLAAVGVGQQSLFDRDNLELFYLLLNKSRFTTFDGMVDEICVNEADWHPVPLDSDEALEQFIAGSRDVLGRLKVAARAQIGLALDGFDRWQRNAEELRARLVGANQRYSELLPDLEKERLGPRFQELVEHIGQWGSSELEEFKPRVVGATFRLPYQRWRQQVEAIGVFYRESFLEGTRDLEIYESWQVWRSKQPDPEKATSDIFAEQVAYVFFVRLMLARVLEDKGILPARVISDGGFLAWRNLVRTHFNHTKGNIHGSSLVAMLFRNVSAYYQHFFQQPVFDWFVPDDYLLVSVLRHLNRYSFAEISADVLGFTYENYIDRTKRNKKGHFLTRPEVVQFILDEIEYKGSDIIGRKVLDPACGSGSFLIHAARRLRQEIRESVARAHSIPEEELGIGESDARTEFASRYIEQVKTLLHGMEIDPFACYLSELNLFVQILDDLHYLWRVGQTETIDRFQIYCTDSLNLPPEVLQNNPNQVTSLSDEGELLQKLDEAFPIKAKLEPYQSGFMYVVANPPYITSKRQQIQYNFQEIPFYRQALSGDANMYLVFMRLGEYYTAPGGRLAFIVPLTLIADDSAKAIRKCLTSNGWHLQAVTRFYTSLVLFPGVDQHVCVFVAEHSLPPEEYRIQLRGGNDVGAARNRVLEISGSRVVNNTPIIPAHVIIRVHRDGGHISSTWPSPWLVVMDDRTYNFWDDLRNRCQNVIGALLYRIVEVRQGDANTTHLRPLRLTQPTPDSLPVYSGKHIQPYAPLPNPDEWVTTQRPPGLNPDQERAWEGVCRIADLVQEEYGFVLQEVVNIPVHCRIRGTWFSRSRANLFLFRHTAWRFLVRDGCEEKALALFGFLTSHLICYIYGLFSTSTHLILSLLYRLPMPDPDTMPVAELADLVICALEHRKYIDELMKQYDGRLLIGETPNPCACSRRIEINPLRCVRVPAMSTVTLRDALDRGLLQLPRNRRVETALRHVAFQDPSSDFTRAATLILAARGQERLEEVLNQELPEPIHAGRWLQFFVERQREVQEEYKRFMQCRQMIDGIVCEWYGVTDPNIRNMVITGLPWEYANRGGILEEEDVAEEEARETS